MLIGCHEKQMQAYQHQGVLGDTKFDGRAVLKWRLLFYVSVVSGFIWLQEM